MPLFRGTGGAVFDIASPDPALIESAALVPVEPAPTAPEPVPARKRTPKQPPKEA